MKLGHIIDTNEYQGKHVLSQEHMNASATSLVIKT